MSNSQTMNQPAAKEQLHAIGQLLVDSGRTYPEKRDAIACMHTLLVEHGAVDAHAVLRRTDNKALNSGLAISPVMAAQCAFDVARTTVFLQGILAGLRDLLQSTSQRPLQVLYAGCGPYATLVLPILQHFRPEEIQFTLLDVFPESLQSVQQITRALGLEKYFRELKLADATTFRWEQVEPLHAIITETMQVTLKRETHVAIVCHLVPQLAPGGKLFPEQVDVSAALVRSIGTVSEGAEPQRTLLPLGYVATLNVATALRSTTDFSPVLHGLRVPVPQVDDLPACDLELHTRIQVYGPHVLQGNDSGLTMPYHLTNAIHLHDKKELLLNYGPLPDAHVRWKAV